MMAAKSLIALYRLKNPTLLAKKDRGKEIQQKLHTIHVKDYGEKSVMTHIEGIEYLNDPTSIVSEDEKMHNVSFSEDEWKTFDESMEDEDDDDEDDEDDDHDHHSSQESYIHDENMVAPTTLLPPSPHINLPLDTTKVE
jgi:protein SDA1